MSCDLRTTFDDSPELYDRTRPVGPPQLFDDLVALAGLRDGARLVEVGCGTGQATLPLAERGFEVVCVELGAGLAAFARRKLAAFPNVQVVAAAFEEWDAGGARFDAVVAFNAFHWIDPAIRYAKPARLLVERGALAVVAMRDVVPDDADPFWAEVQEDYAVAAPGSGDRAPPHPDAVGDLRGEIAAGGYFGEVAVRRHLWEVVYTADEYLALLETSSWHRTLDAGARRTLFDRVRRRIEARPGGRIARTLLATLNVARRL